MAGGTAGVRESALRLLSRREHSREEMRRKLARKFGADFAGEIEAELGRLAGLDLLSDSRFALAYARSVSGRFAARRVRAELKRRGVGEAEIDSALAESGLAAAAEDGGELARAREMIARRRRADLGDADAVRRENAKLMRWLTARGFGWETARRAVEGAGESGSGG